MKPPEGLATACPRHWRYQRSWLRPGVAHQFQAQNAGWAGAFVADAEASRDVLRDPPSPAQRAVPANRAFTSWINPSRPTRPAARLLGTSPSYPPPVDSHAKLDRAQQGELWSGRRPVGVGNLRHGQGAALPDAAVGANGCPAAAAADAQAAQGVGVTRPEARPSNDGCPCIRRSTRSSLESLPGGQPRLGTCPE